MDYKSRLNEKQYEAVTTSSQYCRIIAGAGSGKTRVLTHRIAFLIEECAVWPQAIFAITFTNKAAHEMKERVISILGDSGKDVKIMTYHAFCAQFLRREIKHRERKNNFVILDEEDQKQIIKALLKDEGHYIRDDIGKSLINYISRKKTEGLYPEDIFPEESRTFEKRLLHLYRIYEERLAQKNALDFDDLLLLTLKILESNHEVCSKWQKYFKHILVDEFQDTNDIQYRIVKSLMSKETSLFVVGDPDQTIYTWRGANQDIILSLQKDFNAETIVLEENYRSTKEILDLANKLIKHNSGRIEKNLFTNNEKGDSVICKCFNNQYEEAQYVARQIKTLVDEGKYSYKDIAVMYRANYLTLPYEKIFMKEGIAYRLYGGQKFYQRKEVKDVLAYLRLIDNIHDDIAFERILNVPRRGIGDGTIEKIRNHAIDYQCSFADFIKGLEIEDSVIQKKQIITMRSVIEIVEKARENIAQGQLAGDALKILLEEIQYYDYLRHSEDNNEERINNVETLIKDVEDNVGEDLDANLNDYLQNVALMSSQDYIKNNESVTLMTVHTAKGLEFPMVFLVSMNEGVFPNQRAQDESQEGMEEERRLCYVAYTRAMKKLYITSYFNSYRGAFTSPSIFIKESELEPQRIKIENVSSIFDKSIVVKPTTTMIVTPEDARNTIAWHKGDMLSHAKFGKGIILSVEGKIIEVAFSDGVVRKLLGSHSMISAINKEANHEA